MISIKLLSVVIEKSTTNNIILNIALISIKSYYVINET